MCVSGMNTEGIYRIPGNKLQVELLQGKLQEGMLFMWFWNKTTRKASYNMQIISEQIRVIINVDISLSYIKNCILTNPCVEIC